MIETMVVVCDGTDCGKKCFAPNGKLPEPWKALQWRAGMVVPPDAPPSGRYDFCSPECFQSFRARVRPQAAPQPKVSKE